MVLVALAGVAFGTSTFAVRAVTVAGAAPEDTTAVRDAVGPVEGENLLLVDTTAVAGRVLTIPRVATVDVRRSLPATVTVTVTEREPVVAVAGAPAAAEGGPGFALVDAGGFAYRSVPTRPAGVPALVLPPGVAPRPDDPATRAAVAVVSALPAPLRRGVTEVSATGGFDVGLALVGERRVRWGADADNARKAAVLGPLLTRPGRVYDVSSPALAVVS